MRDAAFGLLMVFTAGAQAQIVHADGPLPSFEVATLKPWQPPVMLAPSELSKIVKVVPTGPPPPATGRVHFIGQAEILIEQAYGLPIDSGRRIVGGPEWMRSQSDRYELSAKIDEATWATLKLVSVAEQQRQISLMEQSLLAERFGLKVHFEQRETTVFALVQAKGGAKLTPASADERSSLSASEHAMVGRAVTMQELAASPFVKGSVSSPLVVNQTGLSGAYDFTLQWETVPDGSPEPMPVRALMEQQLGLKLVPSKAPMEVIVVDHIERPTAN